jgi:D-alanine-D-alanine ligase
MARVDFIVADDGTALTLEVNTTPGMSHGSNFVAGAALAGLTEPDLVTAVLREALTRPRYDAPLPAPDFVGRPVET